MIIANFPSGIDEIGIQSLTQWDYGQKLAIYGLNLPDVAQVHFANRQIDEALIRVAYKQNDGHSEVDVPNSLLESNLTITAYIYLTDETSGQTIKTINIPVEARTKPSDIIDADDPTYNDIFAELVEYSNQKLEEQSALINQYRTFSDVRIMSKAEYNALEEKEEGVIYAFSDDTTLEDIQAAIDELEEDVKNIESGDEEETPVQKTLYMHNITIYGSAGNEQTGGITCQILSGSDDAFTFDTLRSYLSTNGFTDNARLLKASGAILDIDCNGYWVWSDDLNNHLELKNRDNVNGIYCDDTRLMVVHTSWFATNVSVSAISDNRRQFELSTSLFSINDIVVEV